MATQTVGSFKSEVIETYRTIIDIVRYGGDSGIVTNRRQAAYRKGIEVVKAAKATEITKLVRELEGELTTKPCKIMKDLHKNGKTILEEKHPYNGVTIKDGKVVGDSEFSKKYNQELESFGNLSQLTGVGIGIGDSSVSELVKMGYTRIDQLKKVYEENKLEDFRKGLKGPLCKYFENEVHDKALTRDEATLWKNAIDKAIDSVKSNAEHGSALLYKIAGSYARKKKIIGDIDYVVSIDGNDLLYKYMNKILDAVSEITQVGSSTVELGTVDETPSKPKSSKRRYGNTIKLWFVVGTIKVKVEIYGYSQPADEWCFPYLARSGAVDLQKKIKFHASKKGYKLGPWALDKKGTDTPVWEYPEGKVLMEQRIGKPKPTTIRELFKFLEYQKN